MDHPASWEVSIASGGDEPGRLTFVDRRYTRLDLRWRPLKHPPNLDLMLEKYRQKSSGRKGQDVQLGNLTGCPADWKGVVRQAPEGLFVHAGRFFKSQRLLVEAAIIWPERRDKSLERAVLASIAPQDLDAPQRHWRALGLDVTLDRDFELIQNDAKVGRVTWTFGKGKKHAGPRLLVERLAMVQYWLKQPLADWLTQQLPIRSRQIGGDETTFNGHPCARLLSHSKSSTVASLRGRRRVELDMSWHCPTDERVYRLAFSRVQKEKQLELPTDLAVGCCQATPKMEGADA